MIDITTIASGVSGQVKIGWAIWLLWASVLVEWYWRGRSMTPIQRLPPRRLEAAGERPTITGAEANPADSSTVAA